MPPTPPTAGLTAAELALVLDELRDQLRHATIADVARIRDRDDLLLFADTAVGRLTLHIAPGGTRARVCATARRFAREELATGPQVDRLLASLVGGRLGQIAQGAGERCCRFEVTAVDGRRIAIVVELFGPRGLWCVVDAQDRIAELSRLPTIAGRALRPGAIYQPPTPPAAPTPATPARFSPPWNASVDAAFTAFDRTDERDAWRARLQHAIDRASAKLAARITGLERQRDESSTAAEVRRTADLLLAYGFAAARGATELVVPDPERAGAELRIALERGVPVQAQAQALYRRARKLEDAIAVTATRLAQARAERAHLTTLADRAQRSTTADELGQLERELVQLRCAPAPPRAPTPAATKLDKATRGEEFRRFVSAEGYDILVGKTNTQNDRLTLRVARGNDLWLHVGQGHAGSHVVVRLPRGKTASLESLLDAGTLAIHFSKARGATRCDVVYTFAKHVRKPKGAPPGQVAPNHTKTITVRLEPARLRRLLAGTPRE